MKLSPTAILYISVMLISGAAIGILVVNRPALQDSFIPPIGWPLGVSLLLDLAIIPLAARGRIAPLTMNERVVGFIGAGLIMVGILRALG